MPKLDHGTRPAASSSLSGSREQARYVFQFLTPHKILLLVLIHAYCHASIPPKFQALIFKFLLDQIETPKERDPALVSLKEKLSGIPSTTAHKNVYDVLLELIWSLQSFDQFHTFMMSISNYLASRMGSADGFVVDKPILLTSILGRFVRKCRLEYVKLDFEGTGLLWSLFEVYRAPMSQLPKRKGTTFRNWMMEKPSAREVSQNSICSSRDDIEKLCRKQIEQLEHYGSENNPHSHARILDIISSISPAPASSHFIKFKSAVRSGDYFSAVGHLHSFFDHTITLQLSASDTPNFYQFALLHLAILHEQFHNYPDATWAIREAINTARENKDNPSLLFSLAWLHQFAKKATIQEKKEIPISREESLQYLKMKTKEANLPSLQGMVNLIEAQQLVRNGGPLASVFENVLKTSHVNVVYGLSASVGQQMAFQSALWSRLGNQRLSSAYNNIFLDHYATDSLIDDVARAQCMKAHQCLKEGRIRECFEIFDKMASVASQGFHIQNSLEFYRTTAEIRLAVNRKHLTEATAKLEKLKALQYYDVDTTLHVLMAEVDVDMLRGDFEEALAIITQRFEKLNKLEGDVGERLYLILLHARLLVKLRKPAKALSTLIRCVDLSEKYSIRAVHLSAVSLLAKIMNELDQAQESYRVLTAVMPYIIEAKDVQLEASSYMTLAESLVAMSDDDITRKNFLLARGFFENAREGFEMVEDVENELLCLGKLAAMFDDAGDTQARDVVARRFCKLNDMV